MKPHVWALLGILAAFLAGGCATAGFRAQEPSPAQLHQAAVIQAQYQALMMAHYHRQMRVRPEAPRVRFASYQEDELLDLRQEQNDRYAREYAAVRARPFLDNADLALPDRRPRKTARQNMYQPRPVAYGAGARDPHNGYAAGGEGVREVHHHHYQSGDTRQTQVHGYPNRVMEGFETVSSGARASVMVMGAVKLAQVLFGGGLGF